MSDSTSFPSNGLTEQFRETQRYAEFRRQLRFYKKQVEDAEEAEKNAWVNLESVFYSMKEALEEVVYVADIGGRFDCDDLIIYPSTLEKVQAALALARGDSNGKAV